MGAQRCAPAAARETLEAGNEGKMLQPWLLDDLASSLTIPKSYGILHQCGTMSKLFVHSEKTRKKYRWVSKYHFFLFSLMWKNFKHSWHFWYFEWFWPFHRLHPSMYCRCIPPLPCLQKHHNPPGCQADPKVKPGVVGFWKIGPRFSPSTAVDGLGALVIMKHDVGVQNLNDMSSQKTVPNMRWYGMKKSWLAFKESSWIQVFFVVTSRKKDEKGIRGELEYPFTNLKTSLAPQLAVYMASFFGGRWLKAAVWKFEPKTKDLAGLHKLGSSNLNTIFSILPESFSDSIFSAISNIPIQYGYDIYVTRVLPSMPDRTHVVVTAMLVYKICKEMRKKCTPKKNECRKVVFQPSFLRGCVRLQFTTAFFHIFGELSDVKLRFAWADLAIK